MTLDFDNPFVIGIFWAIVLLIVCFFAGLFYWQRHIFRTQAERHERDNIKLSGQLAVLDERIRGIEARNKERDKTLNLERRVSLSEIAAAQDHDASSRIKAQSMARTIMALENYLLVALGTLHAKGVAVPPPPPPISKIRKEDEFYPAIDLETEQRLWATIKGYEDILGGGLWEGLTNDYEQLIRGTTPKEILNDTH